jgi:hypothetical protein
VALLVRSCGLFLVGFFSLKISFKCERESPLIPGMNFRKNLVTKSCAQVQTFALSNIETGVERVTNKALALETSVLHPRRGSFPVLKPLPADCLRSAFRHRL